MQYILPMGNSLSIASVKDIQNIINETREDTFFDNMMRVGVGNPGDGKESIYFYLDKNDGEYHVVAEDNNDEIDLLVVAPNGKAVIEAVTDMFSQLMSREYEQEMTKKRSAEMER